MAKRTETTDLAPRTSGGALAVADEVDRTDVRGKEGLDRDDLVLPRLALCQALSPEKDEDNAAYIEGLKEGDIFNTLFKTNYSRGPVEFVVIRVDKRAVEFDADRNIVDFNVPWDDPRCEFTSGDDGTRLKPKATRFYDVIGLLADGTPAVLSLSNTKIKVAKRLNSLLLVRPGSAWAGLFTVSSVKEEKNGNKYWNFKIDPAGPTPAPLIAQAQALYEQFRTQTITVDRRSDEETAPVNDDNVPF